MPVDCTGKELKVGQTVVFVPRYASTKGLRVAKVSGFHPVMVELSDSSKTKRYPNELAIVEEAPNGEEEA
uniref:Uncharacterized protein n=3 Tax=unclassified bacterial viruses TaxID=12333 RepID=A0AAU6W155_9VIRU